MNTYIIGDLQGCLDEFQRLLDALRFAPGSDEVWLLGDLVNRGPKSLETLRLAKSLGDSCTSVLGNHDLSILARIFSSNQKLNGTAREIAQAPDAGELLDWLRNRPLIHAAHDHVMLHAGLPPQWTIAQALSLAREVEDALRGPRYIDFMDHMYGDEPKRWSETLTGQPRLRFIVNCFTRLRYCKRNGALALDEKLSPQATSKKLYPWFAHPERQSLDSTILFGHWSTLGNSFWPQYRVWGLDTGCVWGGRLTALHLQTQRLIAAPGAGHKKPGGD